MSDPVTPIDPAPRPVEDSSSLASLHAGRLIGGRYVLSSRLAIGGMGEVWRALHNDTSTPIALKVLRPELAGQQLFLSRLRNEATNASRLHHPNLAQVYDSGEEEGLGWIAMELVEGTPLTQILADNPILPIDFLLSVMMQTANALDTVHRAGIVHRDIKPGNLMVTPQGMVKLTDFGISRANNQVTLTAAGMVMGTAQYLPPEQAVGNPATPAGDLYALGVIAYESLAGKRPFTGKQQVDIAFAHVNKPVPALPDTVPAPLAALVMALLEKDPRKRPPSALALGDRIEQVMCDLGISFARKPEDVQAAAEAAKRADADAKAQAQAISRAEEAEEAGLDLSAETPGSPEGVANAEATAVAEQFEPAEPGEPVEDALSPEQAGAPDPALDAPRVLDQDADADDPQPADATLDPVLGETEAADTDWAVTLDSAGSTATPEAEDTAESWEPRAHAVTVEEITPLGQPVLTPPDGPVVGDEDVRDRAVPLEADGSPITSLAGGYLPAPEPMPASIPPDPADVQARLEARHTRDLSSPGADISDTTSRPVQVILDGHPFGIDAPRPFEPHLDDDDFEPAPYPPAALSAAFAFTRPDTAAADTQHAHAEAPPPDGYASFVPDPEFAPAPFAPEDTSDPYGTALPEQTPAWWTLMQTPACPMPTDWSVHPVAEDFDALMFAPEPAPRDDTVRHCAETPLLAQETWLGPVIAGIVLFVVTFLGLVLSEGAQPTRLAAPPDRVLVVTSSEYVKESPWLMPPWSV